jgi:hypothetical protein
LACYDALFSKEFLTSTGFVLDNYAYYFDRNYDPDPVSSPYYWTLIRLVDRWKQQHRERKVYLSFRTDGDKMVIQDTRRSAKNSVRNISKLQQQILLASNLVPITRKALFEQVAGTEDEIEECLEWLDKQELIWLEDEQILSLPVPHDVSQQHFRNGWPQQWTAIFS